MTDRATELHEQATELERSGRFLEALAAYEAARAENPASPFLPYNIGNTLRRMKRFREAVAAYDQALAIQPGFTIAHFMRATCVLQLGDLVAGFREYEWRKVCPGYDDPRYAVPRQWGGDPLKDRRLFIYPELFRGDLLQFGRFAILAERVGAAVTLAAPEDMHAILQTMSPTLSLIPAEASPADYDLACALMSLPAAFGTSLQTVPRGVYLRAEAARVEKWRERIGGHGLRVGVVWQGSPQAAERSYPLAALEPLGRVPGVRLISLQKGDGLEQLDQLPSGMEVETLGGDFDAGPSLYVDTAAAMKACDLVVTADTSPVHVAGALGVRTWLANPYLGDWRWLEDREDSPWYPTLRIFRQQRPGDWSALFAQMAAELARLVQ